METLARRNETRTLVEETRGVWKRSSQSLALRVWIRNVPNNMKAVIRLEDRMHSRQFVANLRPTCQRLSMVKVCRPALSDFLWLSVTFCDQLLTTTSSGPTRRDQLLATNSGLTFFQRPGSWRSQIFSCTNFREMACKTVLLFELKITPSK